MNQVNQVQINAICNKCNSSPCSCFSAKFGIIDKRVSSEEANRAKELAEKYKKSSVIAEELEKSLKPLGFYNIPELLDKRRLEFGIPNGAFESFPTFDKVYIYQIPLPGQGGSTYSKGGMILKPEQVQSFERNTAPRGIVVSAGLQALDSLYSTGVELGHIVRFKKLSPFIMPVAEIKGYWFSVYVVRDGDIEASEDLAELINSRQAICQNISEKSYDYRIVKIPSDLSTNVECKVSGEKRAAYFDPSV